MCHKTLQRNTTSRCSRNSSDNNLINSWIGNITETPLPVGMNKFINWYNSFILNNHLKKLTNKK